ncbi:EF-hand domain-containing protein [Candidatus Phyllobacterium onerii]|nr:EF-hand domain-containing protein [Phyllobacterium sp. IY22]
MRALWTYLSSPTWRLKQADTNGDGALSQDEIKAMVMKRMVRRGE